jgi:hypothetical protein
MGDVQPMLEFFEGQMVLGEFGDEDLDRSFSTCPEGCGSKVGGVRHQ